MQAVHMNPAEAVDAHIDLDAAESIAMHFGTFQLTAEGIDAPLSALNDARQKRGIEASRFHVLEFGESMRIP
jgi:L-ascorbate metabolism protein UlaG (beta-lactamase superfamily)